MTGDIIMDVTFPFNETPELLKDLDKGIDDMENGRVTAHEETMNLLMQQYENRVSHNS